MSFVPRFVTTVLATLAFLAIPFQTHAATYSREEIHAAIAAQASTPFVQRYAIVAANFAMNESGGRTDIRARANKNSELDFLGLFQMGRNERRAGGSTLSSDAFLQQDINYQVRTWLNWFEPYLNKQPVKTIVGMVERGESIDGVLMTPGHVIACLQVGVGFCQDMIRTGKCEVTRQFVRDSRIRYGVTVKPGVGDGGDLNCINICEAGNKAIGGSVTTCSGKTSYGRSIPGWEVPPPQIPSSGTIPTGSYTPQSCGPCNSSLKSLAVTLKQGSASAPIPGASAPMPGASEPEQNSGFSNLNGVPPGSYEECLALIDSDLKAWGANKAPSGPVQGATDVSSRFGARRWNKSDGTPNIHSGLDFRTPSGTNTVLLAIDSGTILSAAGTESGNGVYLQRDNPPNHVVRYYHIHKPYDKNIAPGKRVSAGQPVAYAGNKGQYTNGKTGSSRPVHLHLDYWVPADEKIVNSIVYHRSGYAALDGKGRLGTMVPSRRRQAVVQKLPVKLWQTDPSLFLDKDYIFNKSGMGDAGDFKEIGTSTYQQYCGSRGLVNNHKFSPAEYVAAQQAMGYGASRDDCDNQKWTDLFPTTDGWGTIPQFLDMSPDGEYDYRSFLERALYTAAFRLYSPIWNEGLTHWPSRQLFLDYLNQQRNEMYLEWRLNEKYDQMIQLLALLAVVDTDHASEEVRHFIRQANRAGATR